MLISSAVCFESEAIKETEIRRAHDYQPSTAQISTLREAIASATNEADMQRFFENTPELLPGLMDLHNGVRENVVVRKLDLAADHQVDFFFLTRNSMHLQYTFVELECISKRVFNADDSFTSNFHKAFQQLSDWKVWFEKRSGEGVLDEMTAPLFRSFSRDGDMRSLKCYLVMGRRSEIEENIRRRERWSQFLHEAMLANCEVMTYDRLCDARSAYPEKLTMTAYRGKQFWHLPTPS